MKKASLLLAFLFCLASAQPKTCFSQSAAAGHWQLIQGDPFPDSVTQTVAGPGSLVYMATSDKGVFKSTDEGENWTEINTGLNGDLDITMLALGPNGDLLARNDADDIFYSKDASTWTNDGQILSNFPGATVSVFAFDTRGMPYAGTNGAGIYSRNNSGAWQQIVTPTLMPGVNAMIFDNNNRLLASYDKLYRFDSSFTSTKDWWDIKGGRLLRTPWNDIILSGGINGTNSWMLDGDTVRTLNQVSIIVDSIGNLYGYYDESNPWDYMEKSTDHGVTWNTAIIPSTSENIYGGRFLETTSQGFITDGAGEPALSVSFDTAFTFTSMHELDNNLSINEIDVDRYQTIQAFDGLGGIWSSTDHGFTWQLRKPKQNVQGTLMEDGKYYSTQTSRGKGIWPPLVSNDGVNYQPLNVPLGIEGQISASPNGTIWLSYGQAHFMRSLDGGANWNEFGHFADSGSSEIPGADSAYAENAIERGPYIWLATYGAIHLTSDDGATWQVDTPRIGFEGISGCKGYTIITHTSGEGFHWLSPGESADSGWMQPNGNYTEDIDGTLLQFSAPRFDDTVYGPQVFIRESKSGNILDTLCTVPYSLGFPYYGGSDLTNEPGMSIDSFGNIIAATFQKGMYRFVSATASVVKQPSPSGDLDVSVTNNVLTITSSDEIQSAEMFDVTGRSLIKIPSGHTTTLSAIVATVPSGVYLVKAETSTGTIVRKVMIAH